MLRDLENIFNASCIEDVYVTCVYRPKCKGLLNVQYKSKLTNNILHQTTYFLDSYRQDFSLNKEYHQLDNTNDILCAINNFIVELTLLSV